MAGQKQKAPGKAFRNGISLKQFISEYPTDEAPEQSFFRNRWPDGVCCPKCGSVNVQTGCKYAMPYRCREQACGRLRFRTKTGTVMGGSKIGYQDWLIAMYLLTTSMKGVSSMKLHCDLDITRNPLGFLLIDCETGWLICYKSPIYHSPDRWKWTRPTWAASART